jgi:hypothetical protein
MIQPEPGRLRIPSRICHGTTTRCSWAASHSTCLPTVHPPTPTFFYPGPAVISVFSAVQPITTILSPPPRHPALPTIIKWRLLTWKRSHRSMELVQQSSFHAASGINFWGRIDRGSAGERARRPYCCPHVSFFPRQGTGYAGCWLTHT